MAPPTLKFDMETGSISLAVKGKGASAQNSVLADPAVARERGKNLSSLNEARKLAQGLGVSIDKDSAGGWWVTCSKLSGAADPLDGVNFCDSGSEVLQAVQVYDAALKQLG